MISRNKNALKGEEQKYVFTPKCEGGDGEKHRTGNTETQHCNREKETYIFCNEWEQWEDVERRQLHDGEWM